MTGCDMGWFGVFCGDVVWFGVVRSSGLGLCGVGMGGMGEWGGEYAHEQDPEVICKQRAASSKQK